MTDSIFFVLHKPFLYYEVPRQVTPKQVTNRSLHSNERVFENRIVQNEF